MDRTKSDKLVICQDLNVSTILLDDEKSSKSVKPTTTPTVSSEQKGELSNLGTVMHVIKSKVFRVNR